MIFLCVVVPILMGYCFGYFFYGYTKQKYKGTDLYHKYCDDTEYVTTNIKGNHLFLCKLDNSNVSGITNINTGEYSLLYVKNYGSPIHHTVTTGKTMIDLKPDIKFISEEVGRRQEDIKNMRIVQIDENGLPVKRS